jgi:hypothetical protein
LTNSTEQKTVSYKTLHDGSIVSIQLPKKVTLRQKLDAAGTVEVEYLHWGVNLPGGVVNAHVYATDMAPAGTTIRARVEVMVKTTETGREFILVNFHPVDKAERPTHKLVILDNAFEQKADWLVFPAPNMRGFVALIGPDEKLVPPMKQQECRQPVVGKQQRAPSVPSSAQSIEGNRPFADVLAALTN